MQFKKFGTTIQQFKSSSKKLTLNNISKISKTALIISALSTVTGVAYADSLTINSNTMIALGTPVTGFNRQLSQPIWDFGAPYGTTGMNTSFGHNESEGATNSLDLTPDSSPDTVLASGFDPNFAAFFPTPADEVMNIPFHETAIITAPDGSRAAVPNVEDAAPWQASKSYPNNIITLEEWMRARGEMKIVCSDDSRAVISIKARNLIENGLYTLWGMFEIDADADGNTDFIAPIALGGVPNAMVPDESGRAEIRRRLGFCPMTESRLRSVTLAYHPDGNAYGAEADLGALGLPTGVVTHDHVSWAVNVVDKVLPNNLSFNGEQLQ